MSRRTKRAKDSVDLQEQAKMLTAENERLKAILTTHGLANLLKPNGGIKDEHDITKLSMDMQLLQTSSPAEAVALTPKGKACKCHGNCSTRACGCVKRNVACSEICKCNDERCHNQEPDKENIKDVTLNSEVRTPIKPHSLFSPDTVGTVDQINISKFDDISLRFDNPSHGEAMEPMKENSETPEHLTVTNSSPERLENESFDPLKPRHNLSRTPVNQRNEHRPNETLDVAERLLPMPAPEKPVKEILPPQELNEVVVDWEKHQAARVHCRKCGRGFYPHRVKKHEASCQKI